MAQDKLQLAGITVKQPDEYECSLATTSTADSDRNQYLVMKNTPIGTVRSYSLTWRWLTPSEMSAILSCVLNKSSFSAHYFDAYYGRWMNANFYAANFNAPCKTLKDGEEVWDELSFNIVSINPI